MVAKKSIKLAAALGDFGIGKDTALEFLKSKNVSIETFTLNTKLSTEQYELLAEAFARDKDSKKKSENIVIPTTSDFAEIVIPPVEKMGIKEEEKTINEKVEGIAPSIEGSKILGKIDVVGKTGRLSKSVKKEISTVIKEKRIFSPSVETLQFSKEEKEEQGEAVEEETILPVKKTLIKADEEIVPVVPPERVVAPTKYERLEGPKIMGKIALPIDTVGGREKRKRNRFVVEKPRPSVVKIPFSKKRTGLQRESVKTIDEKTIQDKIKETQARLAGGDVRSFKNARLKRKNKKQKEEDTVERERTESIVQVSEFLTLSEFAGLLDVNFSEVISKCMNLGLMVSINQRLDAEVMELIAEEYGYKIAFTTADEEREKEAVDMEEDLQPCPPVVTIMGHVDHGKTSLIDYIRMTNVVAGEAGGITQKIGAYEVTLPNGKQITFLDTPGHEAFTAMRARGTKVADIAVVIIAADDSVMPQTKEAIAHAQAANVSMIFAINKIDKPGANVDKIKEQLSQMDILVEDWGGKYQCQEISAKQGLNVDILLEKIVLETDLLNLKANPNKLAVGTVLDSKLDKGRGYMASVLVQGGTLKVGDIIVSGQFFGKVKALFNERNHRISEALPAMPALLLGLNGNPPLGEKFKVYMTESEAREVANKRAQINREQAFRTKKHITLDEIGRRLALGNFKELKVIIKADVDGTVEALSDSLQQLSTEEIAINVIHRGVGQIIESDIMLAAASDAIVIAFQVRPSAQAAKLAQTEAVQVKTYSVIYHVIEEIKSAMEGMLQPTIEEKIMANVEIKNVFKFDKNVVAGCQVLEGKLLRTHKIRVIREGVVLHTGELLSLKRYKDDVKEVVSGMECGLVVKNFDDIQEKDMIEVFVEEKVKRNL